jgi:hypothetical protein
MFPRMNVSDCGPHAFSLSIQNTDYLNPVFMVSQPRAMRASNVVGVTSDSEESHSMFFLPLSLILKVSYLLPDTPLHSSFSDGSSFSSSAGESPLFDWCGFAQDTLPNPDTQFSRPNEDSAPEWQGSGMQTLAQNIPEKLPTLTHINPKRGSKSGGDDVCLIVDNLPPTAVVYARFGGNIAPTVRSLIDPYLEACKGCTDLFQFHIATGVLACRLPAAAHLGAVDVTLCQTPSVHGESYGKSLVSFEYEASTVKALVFFSISFPTD